MKSIPLRQWEAAAYAAGRLTQIRRVCKPQPAYGCQYVINAAGSRAIHVSDSGDIFVLTTGKSLPNRPHILACPYGSPGDALALREAVTQPLSAVRWHPVITAVRLERVQDVTTADIQRMGIDNRCSNPKMGARHIAMQDMEYMRVWNRDNPRTPWEDNPYTWVIDMEGVKA